MSAGSFAAIAIALYAGHHVGDYWTQSHQNAIHKGQPGRSGQLHCLVHVLTYVTTQITCLFLMTLAVSIDLSFKGFWGGFLVSGITHYIADRRKPLEKIVSWMPWKRGFMELGKPRSGMNDNPQLATGAWALDQSWHIFWGVFVAALVMVGI